MIRRKLSSLLPVHARRQVGRIARFTGLLHYDVRVNLLGQILPLKPTAISLMANDICNSRCEMCLIWERKKDIEINLADLKRVLSSPLFRNVQYVGVTGGEPTLRRDLPEIFEVICSTLPRLKGPSIITNAIKLDQVTERVLASAKVCERWGVKLDVMVSLDGLNDVHDKVRGREGNFATAIAALETFRLHGLNPSFGCTITTTNAPYIDELVDYAKENHLYGRFRVAEYIDRLYNNDVLNVIRSFDARTAYHLGLLFFRLEHDFETEGTYQKTYRSIRGMLTEGKKRAIACPHQTHQVILSARGEMLYCSPKSPNLGEVINRPPSMVYFSNLQKRAEMIKKDCDQCIHDYHVPVTFREKAEFWLECRRRGRVYDRALLVANAKKAPPGPRIESPDVLESKRVLIVGWYGTETAGDKAILWSIVQRLQRRQNPPIEILLASMYPFVSNWTVREMGLAKVQIVETYTPEFERCCKQADEVVVGGGPLMDLEALDHMLYGFLAVRSSGGIARVEGCGIGPLVVPLNCDVIAQMFRLASHVTLRDVRSKERAANAFGRPECAVVPDPAVEYVESLSRERSAEGSNRVACFLRAWGKEYAQELGEELFAEKNRAFESELIKLLRHVSERQSAPLELLPMHSFHIGRDDRVFNRHLARSLQKDVAEVARLPLTPKELVTRMTAATLSVCMRFHSVVFAETLRVPYLAIDYTRGGKIWSFLSDRERLDRLITFDEVAAGSWMERVDAIVCSKVVRNIGS